MNRSDGPYKGNSLTKLFYIIELYAALIVMGTLLAKLYETEEQKRKEYDVKHINREFEILLSQNGELRTLL
jgi:hypothetical protein